MLFKIKNKVKERSLQIEFKMPMKSFIGIVVAFTLLFGGVDSLPLVSELSDIDIASSTISSLLPNAPDGE